MEWEDASRKVLIAGTGRCGTTFLVKLFTLLKLPTGIQHVEGSDKWLMTHYQNPMMNKEGMALRVDRKTPDGWQPVSGMIPDVRAGLEYHVALSDSVESLNSLPKIIKNPRFATMLDYLYRNGCINVEHVFACVRDLGDVAKSKFASGQLHPKERYYQKNTDELREDSARQLGEFTSALITNRIPHTFLSFPHMIDSGHYLWNELKGFLLPRIMEDKFMAAHGILARKDFVHHRRST